VLNYLTEKRFVLNSGFICTNLLFWASLIYLLIEVNFSFQRYGFDISTLNVHLKDTVQGSLGSALWTKKGNQGN